MERLTQNKVLICLTPFGITHVQVILICCRLCAMIALLSTPLPCKSAESYCILPDRSFCPTPSTKQRDNPSPPAPTPAPPTTFCYLHSAKEESFYQVHFQDWNSAERKSLLTIQAACYMLWEELFELFTPAYPVRITAKNLVTGEGLQRREVKIKYAWFLVSIVPQVN